MRKICVVVTARPSYSRIKTTLYEIKNNPNLRLQLVVSGSALLDKYGSVIDTIIKDGFSPDGLVHMVIEGSNLSTTAKSTGLGIMELSSIFSKLKPDIVISIADRYETIATAIAASYSNIPLAHIQGGEVTGSIDEKVRHAVSKLADIHFVSNQDSFDRLEKMGEDKEKIFITGCPSIDIALNVKSESHKGFNPFINYTGLGNKFNIREDYFILMQHPVTTDYENSTFQISESLKAIEIINKPTFIFWPNVDTGSDIISKELRLFQQSVFKNNLPIYFFKNLNPEDFLKLLINSKCLIGNSSVGIRECSYLGVPVVNIGNRQIRRLRADNVIDVNYNKKAIINAIKKQSVVGSYNSSDIYGDGKSGRKISNILIDVPLSIEKIISY